MPTLSWKRQSLDNGNDNNSDLGYYDDYGNWWWTPVSSLPCPQQATHSTD